MRLSEKQHRLHRRPQRDHGHTHVTVWLAKQAHCNATAICRRVVRQSSMACTGSPELLMSALLRCSPPPSHALRLIDPGSSLPVVWGEGHG